ncbi:MAG: hypothetical protein QOJ37_3584 [Pseudonocardiales bacterium]|nr:hypothetical protein [Pseudonocardiales bacterium]
MLRRAQLRLRRWTAMAATAAVLVTIAGAGGAAAPAYAATDVSGCGAISQDQVGAFVAEWAVHLDDDAFMTKYLNGAGAIPAQNAAEADKSCLVDQLVVRLAQTHPGFGAGRDPQLVRGLLTNLIFDRGRTNADQLAANTSTSASPSTPLDDALARLRAIIPSGVPSITPDLQIGTVTHVGADAIVSAGPSATPLLSAHAGVTYTPSDQPLIPGLGSLPTLSDIFGLLGTIIDSVTYRVCTESAAVARKCSLPTPLGVPVLADDTGDNIPDVVASLLPGVDLSGGAQLQFRVDGLFGGRNAPAHVFAVFSVLGTSRQFAIGFDGRPSRLAAGNLMAFSLKSITRALAGDIDTGFHLQFRDPGPVSAITAAMATKTNGVLSDPMSASLNFNPTPAKFDVGLRFQNSATPQYTVGVQSSVPTKLTAHATLAQSAAGTETAIDGVVDKLPSSITIDVKNNGSALVADYTGSAKIDDLALAARSIPDVTHPNTYTVMSTDLTQIPTNMHLVVTKPYDAVLSTSSPIGPTTVSLRSIRDGVTHSEIYGQISSVPTNVHLHGDVDGAGDDFTTAFTYTADASIPSVHFRLFDDENLHAFVDATAANLPKFMKVSVAKHPHDSSAAFDARTTESGAPGSSSVGPMTLKYTSTGTQLADADLPSTDHVVLKETASDVQAALRYTGLSLVRYSLHDDVTAADHDTVSAELKNASPRVVTLVGDTPALTLNSVIDALPADMTLDYDKQGTATNVHYHATSPITKITAAVAEKGGNHASIGAEVTHVPDDIQIALDQAAGEATWNASGGVDSIGLSGKVDHDGRTWTGGATLTAVPRTWKLNFGPSVYAFQAGAPASTDAVGSLSASLTNHGTAETAAGNHAFANYDAGSGALDASFTMSAIHAFSYTPTAQGFVVKTEIGGGQPFRVKADLKLDDSTATPQHLDQIAADATISPLPRSMTFTQDGTALDYTSDTSPDIDASVAIGRSDAVAATPAPPIVRGAALRDGRACDATSCDNALKAHLFLEGAPSGLHADLGKVDYGITHYAPPAAHNEFNADVVLDNDPDPSKHFSASVSLKGIDPSGQNMHLGPLTTAVGPVAGSEKTTIEYQGNHAVGPLAANVVAGDKTAYLTVSNLPKTMTFSATTRPDGIQFHSDLDEPIADISAFYKPTGAANWALSASLKQIPRHIDFSQLTIGDQPSSDPCAPPPPKPPVPTVDYTAIDTINNPDSLDITAAVDLGQLSSSLSGSVTAGITNLGHDTHASWDGTQLQLDSTPKTDSFEVHVPNARVIVNFAFDTGAPDPCNPSSGHDFISITAAGHVNVVVDIGDAGMVLTDVAHIVLKPGFSTGITGDFGSFSFGWQQLHVNVDAEVHVDLKIDFGGGISVSPTLASLAAVISTDVHIDFAVYNQEKNRILHIFPIVPIPCDFEGPIPTGVYFIDVFITPKRVATGHDGFTVNGTPGSTDSFVITVNPFGIVPDILLDAITGLFTSPFDKGLDAAFECG